MRILLLREQEGDQDRYHITFNESGFDDVTSIPVLDFEFQNLHLLKDFSDNFTNYAGLIFTSKRAIEAFGKAVDHTTIEKISKTPNFTVFVVGRSSESCLKGLGLNSLGSDTGNAKELSDFIIEQYKVSKSEKPLMFACGNLARETIPFKLKEADVKCETISCYKTISNKLFIENFKKFSSSSDPSVIVFFSPSGAEFYLSQIKYIVDDFDKNVKVIAIGQYTAETIQKLNQTCHGIAKKPTPNDLLEAIKLL